VEETNRKHNGRPNLNLNRIFGPPTVVSAPNPSLGPSAEEEFFLEALRPRPTTLIATPSPPSPEGAETPTGIHPSFPNSAPQNSGFPSETPVEIYSPPTGTGGYFVGGKMGVERWTPALDHQLHLSLGHGRRMLQRVTPSPLTAWAHQQLCSLRLGQDGSWLFQPPAGYAAAVALGMGAAAVTVGMFRWGSETTRRTVALLAPRSSAVAAVPPPLRGRGWSSRPPSRLPASPLRGWWLRWWDGGVQRRRRSHPRHYPRLSARELPSSPSPIPEESFRRWLGGLVDGDGHLAVVVGQDGYATPRLYITMGELDYPLLEEVRRRLGAGGLNRVVDLRGSTYWDYRIQNRPALLRLLPLLGPHLHHPRHRQRLAVVCGELGLEVPAEAPLDAPDWPWLAGFFDAAGDLSPNGATGLRLRISQRGGEEAGGRSVPGVLLRRVQAAFGGNLYPSPTSRSTSATTPYWGISDRRGLEGLLEGLRPHCRSRRSLRFGLVPLHWRLVGDRCHRPDHPSHRRWTTFRRDWRALLRGGSTAGGPTDPDVFGAAIPDPRKGTSGRPPHRSLSTLTTRPTPAVISTTHPTYLRNHPPILWVGAAPQWGLRRLLPPTTAFPGGRHHFTTPPFRLYRPSGFSPPPPPPPPSLLRRLLRWLGGWLGG